MNHRSSLHVETNRRRSSYSNRLSVQHTPHSPLLFVTLLVVATVRTLYLTVSNIANAFYSSFSELACVIGHVDASELSSTSAFVGPDVLDDIKRPPLPPPTMHRRHPRPIEDSSSVTLTSPMFASKI
jgi:hypothetical protein